MSSDALARQEGGDHYKSAAIQPVEFWQRNRWDGCACSILKYLARHRQKNGLEDVRKARHFVELRQQLEKHLPGRAPPMEIPMVTFIAVNGITDELDIAALKRLEVYVHEPHMYRDAQAEMLIEAIDAIIATYCAG